MTLIEFYEAVGGDFAGVMGRLMKEERVLKYLGKFFDASDYDDMMAAIAAGDWETGFRLSHNLKGMGLNLGLTPLAEAASALCETMRGGAPTVDITDLTEKVTAELAAAREAYRQLIG